MFTIWEFDLYNEREMNRNKKKKKIQNNMKY